MANLELQFSSSVLQNQETIRLLLPDHPSSKNLPTIWWLHGLGDNGSVWLRKTRLELFASQYQVAIILPDMHRSFYRNAPDGQRYFDYLTEELPAYLGTLLPLATTARKRFLVGNSMGGYGAYRWIAHYPSHFSHVATLSPVTDLTVVRRLMPDYRNTIGPDPEKIPALSTEFALTAPDLKAVNWFQSMGTDDELLDDCKHFDQMIREQYQIDLNAHIEPGKHDWNFWDSQLPKIFEWLPLEKLTGGIKA